MGRAQGPEGKIIRKLGGQLRSGKNTIIKTARYKERRLVRAPKSNRMKRRGKARDKRNVKDAIAADCW